MTADQTIALIKAIAELLSVLIWPGLILVVLLRFRSSISAFLKDLGEFSFKAPGMEATARRRQVEAAANLGAAEASRSGGKTNGTPVAPAPDLTRLVESLPGPRQQRRLADARVLWVDDRPTNNEYERRALEALGIKVDVSTSTEDAVARQSGRRYDLIVSDMGRPPDQRAGYTLLDALRESGDRTPYVIYASSRSPEHVAEARRRGALGCTNRPQELIEYVLQGLGA
jgi:CheY-like chemotaxis protein